MRFAINFTGTSPTWRAAPRKGAKGGGGGGSTTTQVVYSPSEQAARDAIFAQGEALYNRNLPTAGTYQGPRPVGTDPATQLAQDIGIGTGLNAQGTANNALAATNFALTDARNVNSNPYLQAAMEAALRPATRAFSETTMPALRMGGMATGTGGSSRQGVAEGIAARGLQDAAADIGSRMAYQGYQSGLDASLSAARNLPQIMSGVSAPASMISNVGAQRENIAGEREAYDALVREQAISGPWQLLQARAGLMQGMANPTTQTNTQLPRQGIGPTQILGGALGLGSLVGKLSDRRLKERIVYAGEIEHVPVYVFSYKGKHGRWIGTMADEAPAHAVRRGADGYDRVLYERLPVPFRRLEA